MRDTKIFQAFKERHRITTIKPVLDTSSRIQPEHFINEYGDTVLTYQVMNDSLEEFMTRWERFVPISGLFIQVSESWFDPENRKAVIMFKGGPRAVARRA